jgi:hypothetical protein
MWLSSHGSNEIRARFSATRGVALSGRVVAGTEYVHEIVTSFVPFVSHLGSPSGSPATLMLSPVESNQPATAIRNKDIASKKPPWKPSFSLLQKLHAAGYCGAIHLKIHRTFGRLVDVTGIEPVTPCLQIQKTKLDDIKKDGKE